MLVHQARPCLRAKVSAVKLEAIGPAEKDKEFDVLHLKNTFPVPPGPKKKGTNPSVILGYQTGGGRIVRLKQFGVERYCCLRQSGMKGENTEWLWTMVEKGGT